MNDTFTTIFVCTQLLSWIAAIIVGVIYFVHYRKNRSNDELNENEQLHLELDAEYKKNVTLTDELHALQDKYEKLADVKYPGWRQLPHKDKFLPTRIIIVPNLPDPDCKKIRDIICSGTMFMLESEYLSCISSFWLHDCCNTTMYAYSFGYTKDSNSIAEPEWFRIIQGSHEESYFPIAEIWSTKYLAAMQSDEDIPEDQMSYKTPDRYIKIINKLIEKDDVFTQSLIHFKYRGIVPNTIK